MPTLRDMVNANKVGYNFIMPFGKHKGKLITEVLEEDPGYILWASENIYKFNPTAEVMSEARMAVEMMEDEDEDWEDKYVK